MSGIWVLLGLGVLAVIARTTAWAHGRTQRPDLGFVSRQWVAERLAQTQEQRQ